MTDHVPPPIAHEHLPPQALDAKAFDHLDYGTDQNGMYFYYETSADQKFVLHDNAVDVFVWDFGITSPGAYNTIGNDVVYGTVEQTDLLLDDAYISNAGLVYDDIGGFYGVTFPEQTGPNTLAFYMSYDNSLTDTHTLTPLGTLTFPNWHLV
jgi:hypothetical protein